LPILTLDHAGIIREINRAGAKLLGADRQLMLGISFTTFVGIKQRDLFRSHLRRCRSAKKEGQERIETELTVAPRKGSPIPSLIVSQRASDGRRAFWTALVDLTHRAQLDAEKQALIDSARAAREASQAKDLFIAVLSHEMRSPLSAILAAATALGNRTLDPVDMQRAAALIRRNAEAAARLIEDLLDLTRMTRRKVELDRQRVDVHAVAEEAMETCAAELAEKGLSVVVDLRASEHVVEGDPYRLRQVMLNLIKNAIKFTPSTGKVGLRSWNNGSKVVIEVSDTGIGIDPNMLDRLFMPFEQVSKGGGGLGLGLAIARSIVDLHGGRMVASSAGKGKGARFLVELDAAPTAEQSDKAPDAIEAAAQTLLQATGARSERSRRRPGGHILLVEDNADLAESLTLALRSEGYEVKTASSLRSALAADLASVDLVLSDIQLPDGRGVDLVRKLQHRRPVTAIALSGYSGIGDVQASIEAGFLAHFAKPVDMPALLSAIRSATRSAGVLARGRRSISRLHSAGRA
jgi:two-component system CheB/CheR fusion protein